MSDSNPFAPATSRQSGSDALAALQEENARLREKLASQTSLLHTLQSSSPDCVKLLDLDGRLLEINEPGRRMLGIVDVVPWLNSNWVKWWPEDEQAEAARAVQAARAGGTARFSAFGRTPVGEPRWWENTVTRVDAPDGTPTHLLAISRDVTELKVVGNQLLKGFARQGFIVENVKDFAIFTTDPAGRVTSWNEGAARQFGYRESEIIGRSAELLWLPEDRQRNAPAIELQTAAANGRADDERWHLRKDGSRFFASGTVSPIRDETGRLLGFTKVCRDVTEQRRIAQELQEARAQALAATDKERRQLADVFKRSPSFLAVLRGKEHTFDLANDRFYELVGQRKLIGRTVGEALPETIDQKFVVLLDRVFETGEAYVSEGRRIQLQRNEGGPLEDRFIDFVCQAMREPEGTIVGVFVHGVDVTLRKASQDLVADSERRFRQLADAMPQIVFAARPDGHVDYFNERWYEYSGMPRNVTGDESWVDVFRPDELPRVQEVWQAAMKSGQPYEIEYRFRRASDGMFRWHLGRALPIRDEAGNIVRWFGTNTDIHDQRELLEQREELLRSERSARSEAERTNRLKDEFLATLSHELRTPLNAILGWSEIIGREEASDDVKQGIEVIERNARAQAQIIEDLLDMSRIISGKVRLNIDALNVCQLVGASVETLRPTAENKGITLTARLEECDGPIMGDPNRLQQVLWNLLSNAIKFTPRGGRVDVSSTRNATHLQIHVADSGEGIRPEFLPYVFDRFRQADATTTRRHGGLGLGLAIVKQLVELHGGNIRVTSQGEGRGSTFIVSLPLASAPLTTQPETDLPARPDRVPAKVAFTAWPDISGMKIVVIDDEPDARLMVKRLLEDCDAHVRTAGSVDEGLALVGAERPDVIVSDIGMPGEDGFSLIRRLRALPAERDRKTPVIALTAYARAEDRQRILVAGFQAHLSKPIEPAELVRSVAALRNPSGD
ncbi:MAG: PAS domain-containing protein [Tepidisphaeraceae bacterium]